MTSTLDAVSTGAASIEKTPLERYVAPAKPSLVGLSRAALAGALGGIGVPERARKMRAQQLWHWIYFRGVTDFETMTSVSKELRTTLAEHFTLARPEVVVEQVSVDGTRKWLLRLPGETQVTGLGERPHEVETVYIPDAERGTLCVSSQVGCTLTCSFCHTGTQRLVRNLTAGEVVGQIMVARDRLGEWPSSSNPPLKGEGRLAESDPGRGQVETPTRTASPRSRRSASASLEEGTAAEGRLRLPLPGGGNGRKITNIVMMGMGEPLYNFEAVRDALLIVADNEGIGISKRRITLSTSGVVPNIERAGA